ncbi:MAG: hypothetical protein RLZZ501_2259 [Pseudomonadota bacterium]|jgi:phage baseplate assembly protein W
MAGIRGLSRQTGAALDGLGHLGQSIGDILTTPKGTRVMRRDYGSDLPGLLDRPLNAGMLVDLYAAIAEALDAWEPRLRLTRIDIPALASGTATLDLTGIYTPDGSEITLAGIVV